MAAMLGPRPGLAKVRTIFWRRFFEWLLELLALGLLPWFAHLIVSGGTDSAWQRPELYLFVMVISVTSVFDVIKDKATINVTKPLAAVTGIVGAVLAPAAYARLSLPLPVRSPVPPGNQFLQSAVLWIIVVALVVYGCYRVPIIIGRAKGEAEAIAATGGGQSEGG